MNRDEVLRASRQNFQKSSHGCQMANRQVEDYWLLKFDGQNDHILETHSSRSAKAGLKPYALFLYEDVSRTTAAKDIRGSWVDLREGIIEIPEEITKTGEGHTLTLSDKLINMLKKQFRQDDAHVFDTTNSARNFSRHALQQDSAKSPRWFRPKAANGKNTKA